MSTRFLASILLAVCSTVCNTAAYGQSFNVDAGGNFVEPPGNDYGAAALQPGYWNGITFLGPIRDLSGNLTDVLFDTPGGVFLSNIDGASEDDQRLMGSMVGAQSGTPAAVFLYLDPGLYDVYVYCWGGSLLGRKDITIRAFTGAGQTVGGVSFDAIWPGGQMLGVTYDRLRVEVPPGGIRYMDIYVQGFGDFDVINGVQLVKVPTPGAAAMLLPATLAAFARRRPHHTRPRRQESCGAFAPTPAGPALPEHHRPAAHTVPRTDPRRRPWHRSITAPTSSPGSTPVTRPSAWSGSDTSGCRSSVRCTRRVSASSGSTSTRARSSDCAVARRI